MKAWLQEKISELYPGVDFDVLNPPDEKLGDYSINLPFVLAKSALKGRDLALGGKDKKNPAEVGKEISARLLENKEFKKYFSKIEFASPGFVNFYFSEEFLQKKLKEISGDKDYGKGTEGKGKKVIVEYSSPNIAKPMHIGHLRSTIIGDALANVYEELGYEVVRWNYIGDWGTQFGKVIVETKAEAPDGNWSLVLSDINSTARVYVKFHEKVKDNPELEKEAQKEFKKLEEGTDENNKKIWELSKKQALEYFSQIYRQLDIGLIDGNKNVVIKGESDYEPKLKPLIEELKKKGLTKESEGALIIELENLPPAMLRKSDGATLYVTRDIASLEDRIKKYEPAKILYVVANQQALHFEQLFAVSKKLGWTKTELEHVKFGMVLGEDGKKLATREGKVVPLQEVMDKLNELALDTVKEKNPDLGVEESKKIAKVVSLGALKYNDLRQHPYSDITFDWKAMLDLSGNSGPYIQYTYARLSSILSKAGKHNASDLTSLNDPASRILMAQLLNFPEAIKESAKFYALNGLALYLYELSHRANQFYENVRILGDDNANRRNARLFLVETTASILKKGLILLGIETLEKI